MKRHLPSILGCAVGFCVAGSGVGSVAGCFAGGQVWQGMAAAERAATSATGVVYLWMFRGILTGMTVGAAAGVGYALLVRWARLRGAPPDAEQATAVGGPPKAVPCC